MKPLTDRERNELIRARGVVLRESAFPTSSWDGPEDDLGMWEVYEGVEYSASLEAQEAAIEALGYRWSRDANGRVAIENDKVYCGALKTRLEALDRILTRCYLKALTILRENDPLCDDCPRYRGLVKSAVGSLHDAGCDTEANALMEAMYEVDKHSPHDMDATPRPDPLDELEKFVIELDRPWKEQPVVNRAMADNNYDVRSRYATILDKIREMKGEKK